MSGGFDPDERLYEAFQHRGNPAALEKLAIRWQRPSYDLARRICRNHELAEEAVQDTFLKLLSGRAVFRNRPSGSFRRWLLCLVANSARMARRKERRAEARKQIEPREFASRKGLERSPAPSALEHPWRSVLPLTLAGIEERWRKPIILHFLNGMPQQEIADSSGVSQQMISKRLSQGLAHLRARMCSPERSKKRAV